MNNQRLILIAALVFTLVIIYQQWQMDYYPPTEVVSTTEHLPVGISAPPAPASGTTTDTPQANDIPAAIESSAVATVAATPATSRGQSVRVTTDLLDVLIDTKGGTIWQADLLKHAANPEDLETPFRLMEDAADNVFVWQTGLVGTSGMAKERFPTHHAQFSSKQYEYRLNGSDNKLVVPLTWQSKDGVSITKTFTFYPNSYLIDIEHNITNNSNSEWRGGAYGQFQRYASQERDSMLLYTYKGGVLYSPEELYEKISFADMAESNLQRSVVGGWAAMIQHYFLGAVVPNSESTNRYYSRLLQSGHYALGVTTPAKTVTAGATATLPMQVFIGPKEQKRLEKIATGLELTVDYGYLTFIAQPLYWLLDQIHQIVGNWGWAIIILTILIKMLFYKLSAAGYRSMADMRKLQPRLTAMKERFGDDKQKMNEAMMKMYREEKINPMGGCLPMLVQIPVFIALYWALLESVELRQAPFALWITDLSVKDPYFILPLIMGISMFIQQKLNPTPPDPIQAKVMQILPILFTVFFAFFPAGLVLYWVVNNIISIAQQWYITKSLEA